MAFQYTWFDKTSGKYLGTDPAGGYAGPAANHPFKDHVKVRGAFDGSRKWDGAKVVDDPDFAPPVPAPRPLSGEDVFSMLKAKGVLTEADRTRPKPGG